MFKLAIKWYVYIVCSVALFAGLMPLEYGAFRFKTVLYSAVWIILGIIVVKLLRDKKNKHIIVKLIIAFGIYIILTCVFLFKLAICKSVGDRTLYINKKNASITIIHRTFECYLTSGSYDLYKCHKITGKLKWITKISENKVDTSTWTKVRQ